MKDIAHGELLGWGLAMRRELAPLVRAHPSDFGFPNFRGACAVASYAMNKLLERLGHSPEMVLTAEDVFGNMYCYSALGPHIIDLTATQFGYAKPVQVTTKPSEWHQPILCRGKLALQRTKGWAVQSPLRHRHAISSAVSRALVK